MEQIKLTNVSELVWYACYGSNLLMSRFLCYIRGGTLEDCERVYEGCTDKSDPKGCRQISLPFQLYFSKSSKPWEHKGVAFIRSQKSETVKTLGRMYLITRGQFVQVVRQENRKLPTDQTINIDFEKAISEGTYLVLNTRWYGRIMCLRIEGESPVITFTGKWEDKDIYLNPPGRKYLKALIMGIKETYGLPDKKIVEYLERADGIKNHICAQEIAEIAKLASL